MEIGYADTWQLTRACIRHCKKELTTGSLAAKVLKLIAGS